MRRRTRRCAEIEMQELATSTGAHFRAAIIESGLSFDPAQVAAIDALGSPARHGYYLWGGVGRGKSLISEIYFEAIPTSRKLRFHFHDFFRALQTEITRHREPLSVSLVRLIGNARAIFFDEFHVHDVADGVYLSAALTHMLDEGILLLATSNYEPEGLMPDPLHHERFRPAINIIQTKLDVVRVGDGEDYRAACKLRKSGFGSGSWSTQPTSPRAVAASELDAGGQLIRVNSVDDGIVSITFNELCVRPLGPTQYLWLAEQFRGMALTALPELANIARDPLARFATLIDVFYDRDVPIYVSATSAPRRIFDAREPPRDAARTVSRLSTLRRLDRTPDSLTYER